MNSLEYLEQRMNKMCAIHNTILELFNKTRVEMEIAKEEFYTEKIRLTNENLILDDHFDTVREWEVEKLQAYHNDSI